MRLRALFFRFSLDFGPILGADIPPEPAETGQEIETESRPKVLRLKKERVSTASQQRRKAFFERRNRPVATSGRMDRAVFVYVLSKERIRSYLSIY